ncbi:hypothetical protein BJV77DRAFT_1035509, partial [Russula vinacea]
MPVGKLDSIRFAAGSIALTTNGRINHSHAISEVSFPRTMPTVTPPPSGSRPVNPRASMQRSHAHRVSLMTSTSPKSGATRNSSVTTNGCGAPT